MANFSRFSGGGGRMAIPALGATAITGAYFYYRSGANNKDVGGQAARSRNKRENEGLSGAGIGSNSISGGHEAGQVGSRTQPGTGDVERKVNTTADSIEKLPGGGADGGGPDTSTNLSRGVRKIDEAVNTVKDAVKGSGSGNDSSNPARERAAANFDVGKRSDIDAEASTTDKKTTRDTYPSSSGDHRPQGKVDSPEGGISQKLQGVFGQGGRGSGEPGEVTKEFNPKIDSNRADTPTRRGQLRSDS